MIKECELALLELINKSPLRRFIRDDASPLPAIPDKDVLDRWRTQAPGVYVVALDGEVGEADVKTPFAIVAVAQNAGTTVAARQGDLRVIGLYDMIRILVSSIHGQSSSDYGCWYCGKYQFLQDPALRDHNLDVALLLVTGVAGIPDIDISDLDDFNELYASWGVVPEGEQKGKPLCEALIELNQGEPDE
ncbi:hypothetical protein NM74_07880 [Aeromonas hydrophila]|uniref:hypothetical protein n=1 Tax=Aeromonas hydrophila TaxID=644 RepID=UPI00053909FF|nr:hypothetical protein [Aeromonas hydrophila]KHA57131.1 hypothetical protein NM74_07880 [Aeromonas hydrophila]